MNILQKGFLDPLFAYIVSSVGYVSRPVWFISQIGALLICIIIPYLLGSISSSVIVSRLLFRDDVRNHGSGNAGLTNMFRTYGAKGAIFTLIGDLSKSALAVLIGGLTLGLYYVGAFSTGYGGYLAAAFCILGHIKPIFYGFRGGKGVLTAFVSLLILSPIVAGVLFLIFVLIVATTKYISLGSCVSAALYPVFLPAVFRFRVILDDGKGNTAEGALQLHMVFFAFFVTAVIVYMHRANIRRIMNHEESRFSFHRSGISTPASKPKNAGEADE